MKRSVTNSLFDALSAVIDSALKPFGFSRAKNSLVYKRILREADQRIDFAVDWFPKYQPGAHAHIHPNLQLRIQRVNKMARLLTGQNNMLLGGSAEVVLNEPIEFTAPKSEHRRWFAKENEQFRDVCVDIRVFLLHWVIPFLDNASGPEELVRLYETSDERVLAQHHWYLFVAAAYEILGRRSEAQDLLLIKQRGQVRC